MQFSVFFFSCFPQHRLQKEANRQVAGLAERAHELAVKNLDQKTKSIYRENVQLAEALSMHLKDSEELRKVRWAYVCIQCHSLSGMHLHT